MVTNTVHFEEAGGLFNETLEAFDIQIPPRATLRPMENCKQDGNWVILMNYWWEAKGQLIGRTRGIKTRGWTDSVWTMPILSPRLTADWREIFRYVSKKYCSLINIFNSQLKMSFSPEVAKWTPHRTSQMLEILWISKLFCCCEQNI
jgi:hypothetical protein